MRNQNKTGYAIEIAMESGEMIALPLAAKTDAAARRECAAWLSEKESSLERGANVFLAFQRTSDRQHGYLNLDRASPTGKSWR